MGTPAANAWIPFAAPASPARLRLFCFPYAGGGASAYRTWGQELPAQVQVCAVQYPGRETRMCEDAHTAIDTLVEATVHGLRPWLDRPFCFFGHSMGAMVAFEVARRLASREGRAPAHFFASAHRAPPLTHLNTLRHDLPEDEFRRRMMSLDGTPQEALASPELMEFIVPIVRADCAVCDSYRHVDPTPLACPITVFAGADDVEARGEDIEAWRDFTRSSFAVRVFPGGHFFLQGARSQVLAEIGARLRELAG
ncbi:MAG TPA: alpha/beta fold hydrolase [Usitatibacter sp.]|nr:alpha/beta fold hydrolase [Usitatibacter sp.]